MKYTNTEVEFLIGEILSAINYYKEGWNDENPVMDTIEKLCNEFKDKYICPYEKYTEEWYDEHGE